MGKWLAGILGTAIAGVIVFYVCEKLDSRMPYPGPTPPNNDSTSPQEQVSFIGRTYKVSFEDRVQGNSFVASLVFSSMKSLKWRYFGSGSSEWYFLEQRSHSGRSFDYYGQRHDVNGDLQEDAFHISFSPNYDTLDGNVKFTWHRRDGQRSDRYYTINGSAIDGDGSRSPVRRSRQESNREPRKRRTRRP